MENTKYYWVLPYAKRLKVFFASDISQAMEKDEFYFTVSIIVVAIEYWIQEGCIDILPHYYSSSGHQVKKYVYVKDPE